MDYVRIIYRPLAARAARQALVGRDRVRQSPDRGRFTRADVDGLLKTAWNHYAERLGDLPAEPTMGSRMNVRLACFTMCFFNAALAAGVERAYAIELRGRGMEGLSALVDDCLSARSADAGKDHFARLRCHEAW